MLELEVALEGGRHVIERLAQLAYLVIAHDAGAGREVARANLGGRGGDGLDGLRKLARDDDAHDARKEHGDDARIDHGIVRGCAEGGVTLCEQGITAKGPQAHRAHNVAGCVHDLMRDN